MIIALNDCNLLEAELTRMIYFFENLEIQEAGTMQRPSFDVTNLNLVCRHF